jgi:hypothetical protein
MSEKIFWICSKRVWMRRPNTITAIDTSGAGASAIKVKRTSACSITATERINVTLVSVQYMIPGPSIMRTAFKSLVLRAMMSPVRYRP